MSTSTPLRMPLGVRYDDLPPRPLLNHPSPGPSSQESSPKNKHKGLGKLRWHLSLGGKKKEEQIKPLSPTSNLLGPSKDGHENGITNDWNIDSDPEDEGQDSYSWIDPSVVGTDGLRVTPPQSDASNPHPPLLRDHSLPSSLQGILTPPLPSRSTNQSGRPRLNPNDSYQLLLSYQSASYSDSSGSHSGDIANLEWHELVNPLLVQSLEQKEVRRQGLWWELVRGEREYVKDLHTISEVFIQPLRTADQLLFSSKEKLDAFIAEVFSSVQAIQMAHIRLLDRLMERQRAEWPLITSVSDLLLDSFLTSAELYEQYMKNYPFAESRVKREVLTNPGFQQFLKERNNMELTRRRDLSVFLSRPLTRLPRILLLLEAILKVTPVDHPDKEAIPTVVAVLIRVVRSSQPGIESAESKIKLWNVAERLLNKKGEIVDLELGDPKRSLVHSAYVFRRVRSETNWHLWQDLHAFLLDNYLLLTRDEENGKYVIVSRPIPLDILELVSADGAPERRYDFITQYRRRSGGEQLPAIGPERLMYPFTISTGAHGRTYTLCTATEAAREEWKAMIENTKRLRQFDLESNRIFAVHILHLPSIVRDPITTAETFTWLDRETLAVASASSVWIGWRRDPVSYQEMIRFATGTITTLTIIPDFPWLLVLRAHALYAYNLADMLPTFSPSTWQMKGTIQGETISAPEHVVAFVRVGKMKGRTLIVYAVHSRNSHSTLLSFHEPLYQNDPHSPAFRHFSTLSVSGYASEILFFRVTITAVTEKGFVVVEPGNPNQNYLPHFPHDVAQDAPVVRLASHGTALGMYQVRKEEFLLVYDWGGCYVDKLGTVTRNGVILRWNVAASYCVYRDPYLIFFDDSTGRAEVRHEPTGRLCEVTEENGMKALRLARNDQAILALGSRGLIQLVETVAL